MSSSSNKKSSNSSKKLSKYLKAPVKMLIKARDFYVRSITECSDSVIFTSAGGVPMCTINTMPRSYSTSSCARSSSSSADDDFRELVRTNSAKVLRNHTEQEFQNQRKRIMPRSNSSAVIIGRIDEDKPCEDFQDDLKTKPGTNPAVVFPRSRSYAVSRRTPAPLVSA